MTKIHRDALQGEIGSVLALLQQGRGRDPLGEHTLRNRLEKLKAELAALIGEARTAANVALVFDGGPVRGSSSIGADFAGKALQDYQELISKHVATSELGVMPMKGRLPDAINQQARMNVTALVHGSFGFVLEEDEADEPQMFDSPARKAVHEVTDLLTSVASIDDRPFEAALVDLDARIFSTLKRFIGGLHRANATLRVAEDERELKLDTASVDRAYNRISQVEVEEIDEVVEGALLGLVPIQRRFDFRSETNAELYQGKVAANMSADYLERLEREGLVAGKRWRATFRTKTVHHPDGRHSTTSRTLVDLIELRD